MTTQRDQYHGVGGSYRVDPFTGERTRVAGPGMADDTPTNTLRDGSTLPGVGLDANPGTAETGTTIDQQARKGRNHKE